MALQTFGDYKGALLCPYPIVASTVASVMDAAGESCAAVGHVHLSTGPGTSKVLSSSGGKIYFRATAATFSDGSTNLRVGVNDVGATGLEDGTHDAYGDWVGGTDTISTTALNAVAIETGSKTITHGDLIAIVVEMTARGGADSVSVATLGSAEQLLPYGTIDTGSGPTKTNRFMPATIEFDDGTLGWLDYASSHAPSFALWQSTHAAFNTGTTPDEIALVFQVPFKAAAVGLFALIGGVAAADDFEVILYSDPLGTPVAERTFVQDSDLLSPGGVYWSRSFTSAYTLNINTNYAIAVRPTTANSISLHYVDFGSGNGHLRNATMLGTNWSQYSRSDQTGAFASQDTTKLPCVGIRLHQLSDDVSAGGGGGRRPRLVMVS